MDTNTIVRATAAAVTGARHLRSGRNGQDAAAAWTSGRAGAVVVCDGCGSGASSEVGARLGAQLVIAALATRLAAGADPSDPELWTGVRAEVVGVLDRVVAAMPGDRARAIHDHFLFTIIAAAVRGDDVVVWAIGDGVYQLAGQAHVIGPFADNQPPYLAYDLLGMPQVAHVAHATAHGGTVVVATDGVAELGVGELVELDVERFLGHPDALRRRLVVLARGAERVDWEVRRIVRTPARLQDDGAIGILTWSSAAIGAAS